MKELIWTQKHSHVLEHSSAYLYYTKVKVHKTL